MFEEFGPTNPPLPPAGAMEQAMNRGRRIRRQRRAAVVSGVALSAALIGGFALADPWGSDRSFVPPAVTPTPPPPDYSPIPLNPAGTPGGKDGLDFGLLTKVTTSNGVVTLHVDRTMFYLGKEAATINKSEVSDWAVKDTDGEGNELLFTLDPKASLQAEASLQDNQENTDERVKLTTEQFIRNVDAVTVDYQKNGFDAPSTVYVWLRHTDGPNGPVTALADQFVP